MLLTEVRGADKLVSDCLATAKSLTGPDTRPLTRCDSAFYSLKVAKAVLAAGVDYSVAVPMYPAVTTDNLLRAAGTRAGGQLAKARTASIRDKLISRSRPDRAPARGFIPHLPTHWEWANHFAWPGF